MWSLSRTTLMDKMIIDVYLSQVIHFNTIHLPRRTSFRTRGTVIKSGVSQKIHLPRGVAYMDGLTAQ